MSENNSSTADFTRFRGRLMISGKLELKTPLRIGAGGSDDLATADISVVKDALGRPFIPGSSFKGVLRSTTESILRTIDERLACLCVTEQTDHHCPTTKRRSKQSGQEESDYKQLLNEFEGSEDRMFLAGTCRACQVFGSSGLASKVQIPDLALDGDWLGRYQLRYGVSIDRDTETAAAQRLFTSEAVPPGFFFNLEITIESGDPAEQGLVLLGLKSFERGAAVLGGGTSRGLGQVLLTSMDCREIGGDPAGLIAYLVDGASQVVNEMGQRAKITACLETVRV